MMNVRSIRIFLTIQVVLLIGLISQVNAQFNVKVGYRLGYTDMDKINDRFAAYNDLTTFGQDQNSSINFLNGLDLGVRYKMSGISLEAGVFAINGSQDLYGNADHDESIQASLLNYYAGVDFMYKWFGVGTNIGTQRLRYKADLGGIDDRIEIYRESNLVHQIHLILEHTSNEIAFSLRPYISYSLSPYNLNDVDKAIFPASTISASEFDQDLVVYGFTLTFYNGRQ